MQDLDACQNQCVCPTYTVTLSIKVTDGSNPAHWYWPAILEEDPANVVLENVVVQ